MKSRQSLLSTVLAITFFSPFAFSKSETESVCFTLQVAAFPESEETQSEEFLNRLAEAGEQPIWGFVDIPGRGNWLRVFVGSFKNPTEARQYGEKLVERHLIKEYLIKNASEIKTLSRPRSVIRKDPVQSQARPPSLHNVTKPPDPQGHMPPAPNRQLSRPEWNQFSSPSPVYLIEPNSSVSLREATLRPVYPPVPPPVLPCKAVKTEMVKLAPSVNLNALPHADIKQVALQLVTGALRPHESPMPGGLWLSGDIREALARIKWIAGKDAEIITLDRENRIGLDWQQLCRIARVDESRAVSAPLVLLDYISANEGLRLLVQITQGESRYLFHIGTTAPTLGGDIVVAGSLNLDNNFDSRINPYRRAGKKLSIERPPAGFDCMIALNPLARWFNLYAKELVPVGNITFHELAESYAKVETGYEYLPKNNFPGAHNIAIAREMRLKEQRAEVVLTVGSNRVLKSEEELQRIYAEIASGQQQ